MEKSTFSTYFLVSPSKVRKNGKAPINLIISLNGQRASISTHKFVSPDEWDATRQRVRGNNETARAINEVLKQTINKLYKKEAELLERGFVITADILRDAYLEKVESIQAKTLLQTYQNFLDNLQQEVNVKISDDTYYNYYRTFELVKDYMSRKLKRNDVQLFELNYSFIANFDTFLRSEYKQRHNTVIKYLKCLKHVINIAVIDGQLPVNPFASYKTEREVVDKPFLTESEIRTIINKDFHSKRLERVRDVFIFCCFTGLSYSDVKTLDRSHFYQDEFGRVWIKKHRAKTGVLFRVPLLPIPKLILEKYKGGETLLPVVHLSCVDAYLKEIADLCGIDKTITSHTARFTFATTVTLTNRVSLEVVSKMLGHTNTKMTEHYAKIVDEYIGTEMDRINKSFDALYRQENPEIENQ